MTETERLLQRQAEWQRARQSLSWPEKIRRAEQLRSAIETFRAQRQRRQARATFPSASGLIPPETQ